MATTKKKATPRKMESSEEEVPVEEEVSKEVTNEEEGERYSGGEIPRVSPSKQNED